MHEIIQLSFILGMALSLGSIATFVVMNAVVGASSDILLIHHQRGFAAAISTLLTVPGVCILLAVTALSVAASGQHWLADRWGLARLLLATLIVIDTIGFVRPLVAEVSSIAERGVALGQVPDGYLVRKRLEDRFGALNVLMIVALLLLTTLGPR